MAGRDRRRVTLEDVWAQLQAEPVYECSLRYDGEHHTHIEGLADHERGAVYIDPRISTIDTLIHELLHRRYPRWGEPRVLRETRRLIRHMADADKRRWWRAYQRIRRKRRPLDVELV